MHIVVIAGSETQKELQEKQVPEGVVIKFVSHANDATDNAEAYFYLLPEENLEHDKKALGQLNKPVIVNAVTTTLEHLPANCIRINAWPGFLKNPSLEISASEQNKQNASNLFEKLNWPFSFVPDIVGLVSPRTISMIINEAYFALGDEVSTKEDIDTAMKLGTNYPHGPFEWASIIGVKNVISLLNKLCITDKRYIPAPLLAKEAE